MRLPAEFIRLPLRVDADRLAEEVASIDESKWLPHPQGFDGNDALPLVAVPGDDPDATKGPMEPTAHLAAMPYLRQVLASLDTVIARSRLMRIEGNGEVSRHVDQSYYWADRVRVHIPIVTTPDVVFECGGRSTHMPAGEVWIFDTWRLHNVRNNGSAKRIHLVVDTVGSAAFWDLVDRGEVNPEGPGTGVAVPFRPEAEPALRFETVNFPVVMTPSELERLSALITRDLRRDEGGMVEIGAVLETLHRDWRATWSACGDRDPEAYLRLVERASGALSLLRGRAIAANGQDVTNALQATVLNASVNPELEGSTASLAPSSRPTRARERTARRRAGNPLDRPVFIVSPPRSGSTLLFETMAQSPGLVTIGGESHGVIEGVPGLHPDANGWESNRLEAHHATPSTVRALSTRFRKLLRDRDGNARVDHPVTLLEKTPKNALRVPFLAAAFPDARFVYLYRDPIDTLASIVEGWRSGRFVTYPGLPGWNGLPWSFLLTPGWRDLAGLSVAEVAARQWSATSEQLIADLEALPAHRWCVAGYGRLIENPQAEIDRLCEFLELPWDRHLTAPLPPSKTTLTPPAPGKWQRLEEELHPVLPVVAGASARAREVFARPPGPNRAAQAVKRPPAREPFTQEEIDAGFSSSSSASFAELLAATEASLLVTTYQTGRVIVVRAKDNVLNTHLRAFDLPMGVATAGRRIVLGTRREVWEFRDQPAVARKIEPAGSHDACFLPRTSHVTGDLRIHDVAFAGDEVWVVNTAFSCLATFDADHSFVPRWRPWFVSSLAPEDRCHLNGMAIVEDRPRYVTALGTTDSPGGWRKDKTSGGVVIDVDANEIVVSGLSMPHSPRWHNGALWVLESGVGRLARVDLDRGELVTVAELPGFTRGLSFLGPFAFVGLSQVRETLFEGVPIKERADRACGVWVVDTRDGRTVAFLRFKGIVQEIYEVLALPGRRFPDLVEPADKRVGTSYVVPDGALETVPATLRG